eukprot:UN08766
MDCEYDECDDDINVSIKKRRICTDSVNNSKCNKRKSRKRKFDDVFVSDKECKEDEDDDIFTNNVRKQPQKRVRLDSDRIQNLLYFDPINLHNDHCPFKTKNKYQENSACIFGWNYCLKLLPNDILFMKQIVQQSKKGNQAKSRF